MKSFLYSFISLVLLAFFLFSCSGTKEIHLSLMRPAIVNLDGSIKHVALLNRAINVPDRKGKIESIVTGEGLNQDIQGRQHVLQGLHYALEQSPSFKGVLVAEELAGDGSGTTFPAPLPWDVIEKICKETGTDAVVALETYDSDCIITHATGQVTTTNAFGISIPTIQYNAEQKIIIKAGFRVYDLKNRRIADEFTFSYWRTWYANANNLAQALSGLINKGLSINQTCYDAGIDYEKRISPRWVNERRTIYTRGGHSAMSIGSRMAMVGNWNEATTYWNQVLQKYPFKRHLCGKATFNLALASEAQGDLVKAREWISKSYGLYNNRNAPYYQNTLNRRYNEIMILNQQYDQRAASDTIR